MNIKRLNKQAIVPTKGSEYAAGYDLYAALETDSIIINPHETTLIGTGWAIEVDNNNFGAIFARSGIATKQGLRPANCVGVVDSDYRGEVKVALHNDSEYPQSVTQGERIAQLIILPFTPIIQLTEVEELGETERGAGGFGSTGTN